MTHGLNIVASLDQQVLIDNFTFSTVCWRIPEAFCASGGRGVQRQVFDTGRPTPPAEDRLTLCTDICVRQATEEKMV